MLGLHPDSPLEVLHAHAQQGEFAPGAFFHSDESITVWAPYPNVVQAVTDLDGWSRFDSSITRAHAYDGLVPGGHFSFRVGPMLAKGAIGRLGDVRRSLAEQPRYEFSWAAELHPLGVGIISRYVMTERPGDITLLTSHEAYYAPRLITAMGERAVRFLFRPDMLHRRQISWLRRVARTVEPDTEE